MATDGGRTLTVLTKRELQRKRQNNSTQGAIRTNHDVIRTTSLHANHDVIRTTPFDDFTASQNKKLEEQGSNGKVAFTIYRRYAPGTNEDGTDDPPAVYPHESRMPEIQEDPDVLFRAFAQDDTLNGSIATFRKLCSSLQLDPSNYKTFYSEIRKRLNTNEVKSLWLLLDARRAHAEYSNGDVCKDVTALVIGGGPCGLRMAIECALLGAKTVVLEMRNYIVRNNVLHLWPIAINDLKAIGAKVFYPKFCSGSVHHVSIRRLQLVLLKVALMLGVELHTPAKFERLLQPDPLTGRSWRAEVTPATCPANNYDYQVVIGADAKRNSLPEFTRKCMRGKLSIAITINFRNHRRRADAVLQEIPGVVSYKRPDLFGELQLDTGVEFENIVYFKDETHYFVMCAKKRSLLDQGILRKDSPDTRRLLAADNVDRPKLLDLARQVAMTSWRVNNPTVEVLPDLEFVINHHDEEDVAIFDFAALHQADFASYCKERHGQKLLMTIVGDSLLEPFWPTGSGIARGFLGVLDSAWLIRNWFIGNKSDLEYLAERESIFRILSQTNPDNLAKNYKNCTIDPKTRYVGMQRSLGSRLNLHAVRPGHVTHLYNTCDSQVHVPRNTPDCLPADSRQKFRGGSIDPHRLLSWFKQKLAPFQDVVDVRDLCASWRDGLALCCVLQIQRPHLVDVRSLDRKDTRGNLEFALQLVEDELGVQPMMTVDDLLPHATTTGLTTGSGTSSDRLAMLSYLAYLYDALENDVQPKAARLDIRDAAPPAATTLPASAVSMLRRMSTSQALKKTQQQDETLLKLTMDRRRLTGRAATLRTGCGPSQSLDRKLYKKVNKMRKVKRAESHRQAGPADPLDGGPGTTVSMEEIAAAMRRRMAQVKTQEMPQLAPRGTPPTGSPVPARRRPRRAPPPVPDTDTQDPDYDMPPAPCYPDYDTPPRPSHYPDYDTPPRPSIYHDYDSPRSSPRPTPRTSLRSQHPVGGAPGGGAGDAGGGGNHSNMQSLSRRACSGVAANRILKFQHGSYKEPIKSSSPRLTRSSAVRFASQEEAAEVRPGSADKALPSVSNMTAQIEDKCQQQEADPDTVTNFSDVCCVCKKTLYQVEKHTAHGYFFHKHCHRCCYCHCILHVGNSVLHSADTDQVQFVCVPHMYLMGYHEINWNKDKKQTIDYTTREDSPELYEPLRDDEMKWISEGVEDEDEEEEDEDEEDEDKDEEADDEDEEENYEEISSWTAGNPIVPDDAQALEEGTDVTETSAQLLAQDQIQSGFEELETEQKELEEKGIEIEENIRQETKAGSQRESELLAEWMEVFSKKKELHEKEAQLVLGMKLMELQERQLRMSLMLKLVMNSKDENASEEQVAATTAMAEQVGQLDADTQRLESSINDDDLVELMQQLRDVQMCLKKDQPSYSVT